MEKAGVKTRDIQFFSHKNGQMVYVHSRCARDYAKYLEEQAWVERYEAGVPLELEQFSHVNPVDIRPDYFNAAWGSFPTAPLWPLSMWLRWTVGNLGASPHRRITKVTVTK